MCSTQWPGLMACLMAWHATRMKGGVRPMAILGADLKAGRALFHELDSGLHLDIGQAEVHIAHPYHMMELTVELEEVVAKLVPKLVHNRLVLLLPLRQLVRSEVAVDDAERRVANPHDYRNCTLRTLLPAEPEREH